MSRYVNPFTDFGFKKLFGEEASKPLLIDFLNSILPQEKQIVNLGFKKLEQSGESENERKAVYDIYCENEKGEKFIIELQKAQQNFFKDRTIFYSTFPIQEQAQKGKWDFELKSVYCIGILDFNFNDYENPDKEVLHLVELKNQQNQVFYDKLKFIYIEMPNFTKEEHELITRLDKWLYFIKHLEDFQDIPLIFKDAIFEEAFAKAEIINLSAEERMIYERNLKIYRDMYNVIDTAFYKGKEEGREEGREEGIAEGKQEGRLEGRMQEKYALLENGLLMNLNIEILSSLTGLSINEILYYINAKR